MKYLPLLCLSLCLGCSTAPQADFMDTFFKSRNACMTTSAAQQVVIAPPPMAVAPAPMVVAPAPMQVVPAQVAVPHEPGCGCGHGKKKKDCLLCRPFRFLHRNRNP